MFSCKAVAVLSAQSNFRKLMDVGRALTTSEIEAVARAFLDEDGDYPNDFGYLIATSTADPKAGALIERLRVEHFKAAGKKPPPFPTSEDSL